MERRPGVFTGGPGPSCTSTTTRRACLRTSASATTSCVCRSTRWPSRRISWPGCARRRGSRARAECDELRLIAKPCDGPWGAGYEHRTPCGMTNSLDFDFGGTSVRTTGGTSGSRPAIASRVAVHEERPDHVEPDRPGPGDSGRDHELPTPTVEQNRTYGPGDFWSIGRSSSLLTHFHSVSRRRALFSPGPQGDTFRLRGALTAPLLTSAFSTSDRR